MTIQIQLRCGCPDGLTPDIHLPQRIFRAQDGSVRVNLAPGAHITEDERKAMLQLVTQFENYPGATGLSHLVGLLIRDAAKGRQA